jgi:hypothetical protein
MENLQSQAVQTAAPPRRWPLFLLGLLCFVAGPVGYFIQIGMKQLTMPWYAPVLATVGVLLMAASFFQRRGVMRAIGLLLFLLMCGFEWLFVLVIAKSPLYEGPAKVGQRVPVFAASLADGTPFTNKDLENGTPTVLLFFRGRW